MTDPVSPVTSSLVFPRFSVSGRSWTLSLSTDSTADSPLTASSPIFFAAPAGRGNFGGRRPSVLSSGFSLSSASVSSSDAPLASGAGSWPSVLVSMFSPPAASSPDSSSVSLPLPDRVKSSSGPSSRELSPPDGRPCAGPWPSVGSTSFSSSSPLWIGIHSPPSSLPRVSSSAVLAVSSPDVWLSDGILTPGTSPSEVLSPCVGRWPVVFCSAASVSQDGRCPVVFFKSASVFPPRPGPETSSSFLSPLPRTNPRLAIRACPGSSLNISSSGFLTSDSSERTDSSSADKGPSAWEEALPAASWGMVYSGASP
mmetsp:Transcript_42712/g.106702  ORF Transcript_42712/g.106702 Transcript_42712/m.106702 type:complete len:312 (-) Transcript_42712:628-1563(-)